MTKLDNFGQTISEKAKWQPCPLYVVFEDILPSRRRYLNGMRRIFKPVLELPLLLYLIVSLSTQSLTD